jgi:Asp-tRNA(Asn)/Glu-tRNA(Gln) amidotransferase A subunit family amidase
VASPRLTGKALATLRSLAENPVTRGALWKVVSADFGVGELERLPERLLGPMETVPRPVAGAPPRTWDDAGMDAPSSRRTSGAELRAAYAAGETRPSEVIGRVLDRLDRSDLGASTYSPFAALDRDGATAAAAASDARWADDAPRSVLDGIPVPVKDEFHMVGLPTRGGTSWRAEPADADAVVVTRLRDGGAVLPGKAHATENGMNPLGFNPNLDHPRNPYSSGHGAGGSSTGSGVAVSLGLAPVAVSTDGGGSIRVPAAMTATFGLKPTFNRLSGTGDIWAPSTVGHAGPIGASTSDLVDLLEVAAGPDPDDEMTRFAPDWDTVRPTWRTALGRGVRGCRIGVLRGELAEADGAIARACEEALEALADDGAVLVDVDVEQLAIANAIGPLVIANESAANLGAGVAAHRDASGDELRLAYALVTGIPASLYLRAVRARAGLRQRLAQAIADVDVLALPAHARLAPPYPLAERGVQVADTAWTAAMTRFSFLANLTGLPAASVPVGMASGLPIGLQVVGDAWDEASVLAVAAHLERLGVSDLPLPESHASLLAS